MRLYFSTFSKIFLCIFCLLFLQKNAKADRLQDSLILVELYNDTEGQNWTDPWDLSQPINTWSGVNLNADGCVLNLYLSNNQMTGNIPAALGNLSNLSILSLAYNQLTGSIPPELGNLNNLTELLLYNNQLTGNIPPEIGNLNSLTKLWISYNELSGSIPSELGELSNLVTFSCFNNQLTGSIPSELGNLNALESINTFNNQLTGSIPPEFGNLSNLTGINLSSNQLTGSIPPEFGNLSNLTGIYLGNNQLSGSIPSELGMLSNLTAIHIEGNQFSGNIPTELSLLNNLLNLWLYSNQLTGNIPPELGNLSKLADLRLSNNQLAGSIPSELSNLSNLTQLWLSNNNLSGAIPPELGNLNNLTVAHLSNNQLSRNIPPELGNLSALQFLYLQSNNLEGCFPDELMEHCDINVNFYGNYDLPGNGNFDAFCNGTEVCTSCLVPSNLAPTIISGNVIYLKWDPVTEARRYRIRYRKINGLWTELMTANIEAFLFVNDLQADTEYELQLKTLCDEESSVWSSSIFFTTGFDVCNRPTSSEVVSVTSTKVDLSWSSNAHDIKYKIKYKLTSGGSWTHITHTAASISLAGLLSNKEYKYKLKTKCSGGWTTWTSKYYFMTLPSFANRLASNNNEKTSINVYPNPTSDQLFIDLKNKNVSAIYLKAMNGRIIRTIAVNNSLIQTDVSDLSHGIYYIQIEWSDGTLKNQKFIKSMD